MRDRYKVTVTRFQGLPNDMLHGLVRRYCKRAKFEKLLALCAKILPFIKDGGVITLKNIYPSQIHLGHMPAVVT